MPVGTTCIEPNQSCTVYIHSILRDGENKLFKYLLCVGVIWLIVHKNVKIVVLSSKSTVPAVDLDLEK